MAIETDSIAFGSTTSGASALPGGPETRTTWRSSTITKTQSYGKTHSSNPSGRGAQGGVPRSVRSFRVPPCQGDFGSGSSDQRGRARYPGRQRGHGAAAGAVLWNVGGALAEPAVAVRAGD